MALRFDNHAMFFVKQLTSTNNQEFIIALTATFLYGFLCVYLWEKYFKKNGLHWIEYILVFISMFVIMSYNFYIILVLLIGKIFGFWIYAV